jgi:hypothetical protein
MAKTSSTTPPESLADFQRAAAKVLASFRTARTIRDNGLADDLHRCTIKGTVRAVGETVEVDIRDEDVCFLPARVEPADLTSAARARYEAEAVAKARRLVWDQLFRMQQLDSSITAAQALQALTTLGYPEAVHPSVKTHVTASAYVGGILQYLVFILNGAVSREDVEAKLKEAADEPPNTKLIRSVFPDATGLPSSVSEIRVTSQLSWPLYA